MKKVAFVCIHNSCRSQIAEALGNIYLKDQYECYSCGTKTKDKINLDALRIMKEYYQVDMSNQYSKTVDQIPHCDISISMGCDVGCPYIGKEFDDNWQLEDPTGKSDKEFISIIEQIKAKILDLKRNPKA